MTTTKSLPVPVVLPGDAVEQLAWRPLPGAAGVRVKPLCSVPGSSAGLLEMAPGSAEPTHWHALGSHHVWVLAGSVTVESTHLGPGSYLHLPADVLHQVIDDGEGSTLFYVFDSIEN